MLQRDYLMELIARYVEMVMRSLRKAVQEHDEQACVQVEQQVASLVGLDSNTALTLSPESLVQLMVLSGVGDSTGGYVAYTLDRLADVYEDMGKCELAETRRAQAEAVADDFQWDLLRVPSELVELDDELFG